MLKACLLTAAVDGRSALFELGKQELATAATSTSTMRMRIQSSALYRHLGSSNDSISCINKRVFSSAARTQISSSNINSNSKSCSDGRYSGRLQNNSSIPRTDYTFKKDNKTNSIGGGRLSSSNFSSPKIKGTSSMIGNAIVYATYNDTISKYESLFSKGHRIEDLELVDVQRGLITALLCNDYSCALSIAKYITKFHLDDIILDAQNNDIDAIYNVILALFQSKDYSSIIDLLSHNNHTFTFQIIRIINDYPNYSYDVNDVGQAQLHQKLNLAGGAMNHHNLFVGPDVVEILLDTCLVQFANKHNNKLPSHNNFNESQLVLDVLNASYNYFASNNVMSKFPVDEMTFATSLSFLMSDNRHRDRALEIYRKYLNHLTTKLELTGIKWGAGDRSGYSYNNNYYYKNSENRGGVEKAKINNMYAKIRLMVSASSILKTSTNLEFGGENYPNADIENVKKLFNYWFKSISDPEFSSVAVLEKQLMLDSIIRAYESNEMCHQFLSSCSSATTPTTASAASTNSFSSSPLKEVPPFLKVFSDSIHRYIYPEKHFTNDLWHSRELFVSLSRIAVLNNETNPIDQVLFYIENMLRLTKNPNWVRKETDLGMNFHNGTMHNIDGSLNKIIVNVSRHIDGASSNILQYGFRNFRDKRGVAASEGHLGYAEIFSDSGNFLKDVAHKKEQKLQFAMKLTSLMQKYGWVADFHAHLSILWLFLDNNMLYLITELSKINQLTSSTSNTITNNQRNIDEILESIIVSNCFQGSSNSGSAAINDVNMNLIRSDNLFRRSETNVEFLHSFMTNGSQTTMSRNYLIYNWLLLFKDLAQKYSVFLNRKKLFDRSSSSKIAFNEDKLLTFPATICEASLRVIDLVAKNPEFDITYPLQLFSEIFLITRANCSIDVVSIVQQYISKLANRGFVIGDTTWVLLMKSFCQPAAMNTGSLPPSYKFGNDDIIEAIIETYLQNSSLPKDNVFHHIVKGLLIRFENEPHRAYQLFILILNKRLIRPHLITYRSMAVSLAKAKAYKLAEIVFIRSLVDYGIKALYIEGEHKDIYYNHSMDLAYYRGGWLMELCSNAALNDRVNFGNSTNPDSASIDYLGNYEPLLQHFTYAATLMSPWQKNERFRMFNGAFGALNEKNWHVASHILWLMVKNLKVTPSYRLLDSFFDKGFSSSIETNAVSESSMLKDQKKETIEEKININANANVNVVRMLASMRSQKQSYIQYPESLYTDKRSIFHKDNSEHVLNVLKHGDSRRISNFLLNSIYFLRSLNAINHYEYREPNDEY